MAQPIRRSNRDRRVKTAKRLSRASASTNQRSGYSTNRQRAHKCDGRDTVDGVHSQASKVIQNSFAFSAVSLVAFGLFSKDTTILTYAFGSLLIATIIQVVGTKRISKNRNLDQRLKLMSELISRTLRK